MKYYTVLPVMLQHSCKFKNSAYITIFVPFDVRSMGEVMKSQNG